MIVMLKLMRQTKKSFWKGMKLLSKKHRIKIVGRQVGFTLIELLIVMSLLAILSAGGLTLYGENAKKARDSRRLSDMKMMGTALENYYDDNGCFPDDSVMNECGGSGLQPYAERVSCDPTNNSVHHYLYERENCSTYRIYARLENESNEQITMSGCANGCGPNNEYNYFASSGNVSVVGGGGGELPTCGGANKYCFPGVCSTCCPGVNYRCASNGELCILDTSCNQ